VAPATCVARGPSRVDVCSKLEQQLHHFHVAVCCRRVVQCVSIVKWGVDVCPQLVQQPHHVGMAARCALNKQEFEHMASLGGFWTGSPILHEQQGTAFAFVLSIPQHRAPVRQSHHGRVHTGVGWGGCLQQLMRRRRKKQCSTSNVIKKIERAEFHLLAASQ
jgi:hypothetical protein